MKEKIKVIIELQEIENKRSIVMSRLRSIPQKKETLDEKLGKFRDVIDRESALLEDCRKEYRAMESDIKENQDLETGSKEKLSAVKTNKEYQAILKGIDDIKKKNSKIEDDMLKLLDRIEETEGLLKEKKEEFGLLEVKIKGEMKAIKKQEAEDSKILAGFDAKWDKVAKKADPDLLKKFNTLKNITTGATIAPVIDCVCRGCNMNIPPQMFNELQRFDSLKFCPHCQRIIYWEQA